MAEQHAHIERSTPAGAPAVTHTAPSGTAGAWSAVVLMITGVTGVTVALPLQSWALGGVSLGVGAVGVLVGRLVGMMGQVH
jgi:hypothetical protein